MSLSSDLGLGVRLAGAGGRHAFARLLLIGSGIALGVGLLLSTLGIFPAEEAVERRQGARLIRVADPGEPRPTDRLLLGYGGTTFGDEQVEAFLLAPMGSPPTPPWLDEYPAPGEIVASPRLAELLASPEGGLLRPRFPGRVVATLEDRWLRTPGELVAYVGAKPGDLPFRDVVEGFGPHPEYAGVVDEGGFAIEEPLSQVAFLISIGLLIPILVFVVTGARLSASARESRLAAIRLVGGTPSQVRLVGAGESLIAGVLGCVLGIALFLATRPILAAAVPPGDRWFPSDIAPPPAIVAAVLVGILALSVGASLVSLRRVVVTPLGVARKGARRIRAGWRWAMLGTGLAGLLAVMLAKKGIIGSDRIAVGFLIGSYGLTGLGAAAAAPVAGSVVARVLARLSSGPGVLLGARRLRVDPRAAGRTVGGIVIVVIAATITSLYVGVYEAQMGEYSFPWSLRASTVIVEPYDDTRVGTLEEALRNVDGVLGTAPAWRGSTPSGFDVLMADCDELDRMIAKDLPSCKANDVVQTGPQYGRGLRPHFRVFADRADLEVRVTASTVRRSYIQLGQWTTALLVPLASVPQVSDRVPPSVVFATTDGDPATVERIRNALWPNPVDVRPRGEPSDYGDQVPVLVGSAVRLGIGITFAIAAATMLIAAVDAVGERRRARATLAAVGTSTRTLRRALTVETALPMLAGVALGLGSALLGTWMVFKAIQALD